MTIKSWYRDYWYHVNPHSYFPTLLPNADRAGSAGTRTRPGVESDSSKCQILCLSTESSLSALGETAYTPFKKSNATRLWSIIFLLSWILIHQVRYPWKACLFAFRLMPYLLGLFHWGACRVSKLGAMSKRKSCKLIILNGKCSYVKFWAFLLWVCMRTHCPFIAPKSSVSIGGFLCNEWAVGTRAYTPCTHKRKAQNLT